MPIRAIHSRAWTRVTIALVLSTAGMQAGVILSASGPFDGRYITSTSDGGGNGVGLEWTSSVEFTNVTIDVSEFSGATGHQGELLLTNAIGFGTTTGNEIVAPQTFNFTTSESAWTLNVPDLQAGTYFLTMIGLDSFTGSGWAADSSVTSTAATGVSLVSEYNVNVTGLLPSGGQGGLGSPLDFSITGTQAPSTPEPGSIVLSMAGLAALAFTGRRFKKAN